MTFHTIEEVNHFLDDTSEKSGKVKDYFPDTEKFIRSVTALNNLVGLDLLDEKTH